MFSRALVGVCLILAALLTFSPALAQDARGRVVGRVTDASGAVVPNADVKATNEATGVAVATKSNDAGNYNLPYLPPGMYSVEAESTGFKKLVRNNVQVRVNDVVELNLELSLGAVSESVQVTAETPLLTTTEASLGQVIDEKRITELPLFAGNAMDLVHLAPGIVNGTDMRLRKAPFNNAPSQFSTDGSGNYNNEFTIDGVSNTYSDGTSPRVAFSPPQAAISEFRVQTSPYDAQVGHTSGALVNVSTKGGTNEFHGSVWWWLRHQKLDAPTIFQNRSGQKLPIYQDNRYGVSGGAPVTIPKLYDGKNRTFWHFTWEANKFGDPNVGAAQSTVPRAAWRNGDLSDLLALGPNYQIYDPATIRAEANGRFSRQPFPGNIIPPSRIHPMAKKILDLYPLPNQPGTADGRQNFFMSGKAIEDYWTTIGRVDHVVNEKNRMFVRVHRDFWEEDKNRSFGNGNNVNGIILNRINRGIAFDDVHVFSPGFLLNFRYGLTQQEFPERRVSRGFDLASLGFSQNLVSLVDKQYMAIPRISIGSLSALSPVENGDGTTASITHSFVGNFTALKGNHNIRFGPEFRVYREFRNRFTDDNAPNFGFDSQWGRGPLDNSPSPPVGGELVSLLLGIPNGSMTRSGSYAEQDKYWGFYVQDDWKISRKLTINLGIRAEHESPITERFNRSATHFDPTVASPVDAIARAAYARNPIPELPVSQFRAMGGLTFAGVGGNSREYWDNQFLTWMPRIGIAYQLAPKTVIRSGYGVFFGSIGVNKSNSNLAGFSQSTPMRPTLDNGLTFIASIDNPFPNGLIPPLGADGGLATNLGQNIAFFANERRQPYAQRWSFTVAQQLPESFVVEVSYVGNRGTRLPVTRELNAIPREYYSTSPVRDNARLNYMTQTFPSPFFGTNAVYTANTQRQQLLRPYPQFNQVRYEDQVGYSWFHSMQTQVERRWARGFTFQMAYTWSKAMEATSFLNEFDAMPYESLGEIDRPHRITSSGQWDIPYGHKRHWGSDANKFMNFVLGGWKLNGMFQRQSGAPLGFGQALFVGDSSKIALPSDQRNADRWFNVDVFNTVAAGSNGLPVNRNANNEALTWNVRTSPLRYSNVRADSQRRLDLSLIKYFNVTERVNFQFRAETFNAMNTPVLRAPNTDPYSSAFGRITAQEPPRSWQFSLKLSW